MTLKETQFKTICERAWRKVVGLLADDWIEAIKEGKMNRAHL